MLTVSFSDHPVVVGLNHASTYSDMMGSMLSSLGSYEEDDLDDEEDPYRRF